MEIVLSINNREDVMTLPVTPSSFTVNKPQSLSEFDVVSKKDLQLIGVPKLKSIEISSFFPIEGHDYPYLHNREMWGWEYVDKIDKWIAEKYPIRLVVTGTPVNMAAAIEDFNYTIKSDGDLWYSLKFAEFNLLNDTPSNSGEEEELDMAQYDELKDMILEVKGVLDNLANPMVYNYMDDNMPNWAKPSVQKMMDRNIIAGEGVGLGLSYSDLKHIVWLDRLGLLD